MPFPDQVPPDGLPVKVTGLAPTQIFPLTPASTTKGLMFNELLVPDETLGLLEIIRIKYPEPDVVPAGIVAVIGLELPEPIFTGELKLPDALLS